MVLSDRHIGRLEALISSLVFTVLICITKLSTHTAIEMNAIRGMLSTPMLYFLAKVLDQDLFVDWNSLLMCTTRATWGMLSIGFMMQGSKLLPISVYSIMSRLNVFGVFILNVLLMGGKFSWRPVILALISFFGVTLVIMPSMYGFNTGSNKGLEFSWTPTEILGLMMVLGFLTTNGFARNFGSKIAGEVSITQNVFYLNLFLGVSHGLLTIWDPVIWKVSEIFNYIAVSAGFVLYQYLFVDSMRREPDPTIVTLIQSSMIIFSMIADIWMLGAKVNIYNIVGAVIVAGTTVMAVFKK